MNKIASLYGAKEKGVYENKLGEHRRVESGHRIRDHHDRIHHDHVVALKRSFAFPAI